MSSAFPSSHGPQCCGQGGKQTMMCRQGRAQLASTSGHCGSVALLLPIVQCMPQAAVRHRPRAGLSPAGTAIDPAPLIWPSSAHTHCPPGRVHAAGFSSTAPFPGTAKCSPHILLGRLAEAPPRIVPNLHLLLHNLQGASGGTCCVGVRFGKDVAHRAAILCLHGGGGNLLVPAKSATRATSTLPKPRRVAC